MFHQGFSVIQECRTENPRVGGSSPPLGIRYGKALIDWRPTIKSVTGFFWTGTLFARLDIAIFPVIYLQICGAFTVNRKSFLLGIGVLFSLGCQSAPDPDLKQANAAMAAMATDRTLAQSCYSAVYPDGEASDFVNYLFSELGAVEWPIAFDEMEEEQFEAIGQPFLPSNVTVSLSQRKQPNSKEIVLVADDESRSILVSGYLEASNDIVFEDQWSLGTAQASEATHQLCQSNLEMGISPLSPGE